MSYFTQMVALTVQNFVSAATGMAVLVALIRGFTRRPRDGIGNFWVDVTRSDTLHAAAAVASCSRCCWCRRAWCRPSLRTKQVRLLRSDRGQRRHHGDDADAGAGTGGVADCDQAARHQRRRFLQRQLGASVREPHAVLELPRGAGHPAHSRRAVLHLRRDGQGPAPGLWPCSPPCSSSSFRSSISAFIPSRRRNPILTRLGVDATPGLSAIGRQHGRQGSALRHRQQRALGGGDHRGFQRLGQRDARQLHAARRPGADVADAARRGRVRRRRLRALRHADVRHHRGVHRRPDGGPHAGVPGQEDRGLRDEDGVARRSCCRCRGAGRDRASRAWCRAARRRLGNPGIHGFSEILYAFSSGEQQQRLRLRGITASGMFYATAHRASAC